MTIAGNLRMGIDPKKHRAMLKRVGIGVLHGVSDEEIASDGARYFHMCLDAMRAAHKTTIKNSYPRQMIAGDLITPTVATRIRGEIL